MLATLVLAASTTTWTVPPALHGRYALAVDECTSAPAIVVDADTIMWFGDREQCVIFVEPVGDQEWHVFLPKSSDSREGAALHFRIEGENREYLLVEDHLIAATDMLTQGSIVLDGSIVGFYKRCSPVDGPAR